MSSLLQDLACLLWIMLSVYCFTVMVPQGREVRTE